MVPKEWRKRRKDHWDKESKTQKANSLPRAMHADRMRHLEYIQQEIEEIKTKNSPSEALRLLTDKLTESEQKLAVLEHLIETKSLPPQVQPGEIIHMQDVIRASEILQETLEAANEQGKIQLAMARAENRLYKLAVMGLSDVENFPIKK
ncbi:MAG: hypothetical protein V1672_05415 [Candidatus Diapherotrites archaeon]